MFHMYVMNIAPTHANMTHGAATPWFGEMRDPIGRPRRWQSYAERACMYREYMYVCMCMVVLMGQAQALAVICWERLRAFWMWQTDTDRAGGQTHTDWRQVIIVPQRLRADKIDRQTDIDRSEQGDNHASVYAQTGRQTGRQTVTWPGCKEAIVLMPALAPPNMLFMPVQKQYELNRMHICICMYMHTCVCTTAIWIKSIVCICLT